MNSIKKIGITGGIGSGKTTVCRVFETLNIPVYYADARAKWLMQNDPILIQNIKNLFGEEAYSPEGHLNRKHIASIVFNSPKQLQKLEGLVHPAVAIDSKKWFDSLKNVPFGLKEAALIYEIEGEKKLDAVIVVTAPQTTRIKRVMQRDNSTEADIKKRMAEQMPQEEKDKRADFLIKNDDDSLLIPQVVEVYHKIQGL